MLSFINTHDDNIIIIMLYIQSVKCRAGDALVESPNLPASPSPRFYL